MRIAHFSDIHFGSEIPDIVDGLLERLSEVRPDLVVASGDFTMAGRHEEYLDARRFLEEIPFPVLATPGNHDIPVYNLPERFLQPLRRFHRYITPLTEICFRSRAAHVLGLNSARPWDLSLDWSHGRLSDKQVAVADRFFSDAPMSAFKALVVHHPFYVPEDLPGFRTIRNADAMLDVLARHRVDAILTGHLHRQFATVRTLSIDANEHDIALLQVATVASSRRRDQPNAFAVIDTGGDEPVFETQLWNGTAFETGSVDPLPSPQTQATSNHKPHNHPQRRSA